MKKKNTNSVLKFQKFTISNLKKVGIAGGYLTDKDWVTKPTICAPTCYNCTH